MFDRKALIFRLKGWGAVGLTGVLMACSSQPQVPTPAELGPNPALLGVKPVWSAQIGPVQFPLQVAVTRAGVLMANSEGQVSARSAQDGAVLWQVSAGAEISAGIGTDGQFVAAVTRGNELVTWQAGRELWRARLPASVLTAPLVAGDRVFVLAADRSVGSFDAKTGRKLWLESHPGDALVLRQAGVLSAVGNTLIVGLGGRLSGIDPGNGRMLWSATLASPRGANDMERLVDLVTGLARDGQVLCARTFQATVGCVDVAQGRVLWRQPANGNVGLAGDGSRVFGVESDGRVLAWQKASGQIAWSVDTLRHRQLSAPLALGRSVVVGDQSGWVHFLSREDGSALARWPTDGAALAATPVVVDQTLVVVTRKGGVFGFRPE